MQKWPGIGERIRERLRAIGYWKADKPDVLRFCIERGYIPTYVYKWLTDTTPSRENLYKLGRDLGVTAAWLLLGDEAAPRESPRGRKQRRPVPIAGGSAQAQPRPAGSEPDQATAYRKLAAARVSAQAEPRPAGSEPDQDPSYRKLAARAHVRVAAAAGFRRRLAARAA